MSFITSKWFLVFLVPLLVLSVLFFLGKKTVKHEVTIQASPEKVWAVLTDTERYPDWNPVMIKVVGELKEGSDITYSFQQDPGNQYDVGITVKEIQPNKLLNQSGGITGVLTYDHRYVLTEEGAATRVLIQEDYRGVYVPFWNPDGVQRAYERLNKALASRVESGVDNE